MGTAPVWGLEWLGRCDWSVNGSPSKQWGFEKHRMGFNIKLGSHGLSVWNPWIKK